MPTSSRASRPIILLSDLKSVFHVVRRITLCQGGLIRPIRDVNRDFREATRTSEGRPVVSDMMTSSEIIRACEGGFFLLSFPGLGDKSLKDHSPLKLLDALRMFEYRMEGEVPVSRPYTPQIYLQHL